MVKQFDQPSQRQPGQFAVTLPVLNRIGSELEQ